MKNDIPSQKKVIRLQMIYKFLLGNETQINPSLPLNKIKEIYQVSNTSSYYFIKVTFDDGTTETYQTEPF